MTSARAMATRCCSPADSWSGLWCSLPVRSTRPMTSRTRSRSSPRVGSSPAIVNGRATFSAVSSSGMRLNDWKTKPGPVAAQARRLVVGQLADRLALEDDLAARRLVEPAEDLQEGRLARTRRAHQRDELAGLDRQRHAAERLDACLAERVRLRQVACLEDRLGRRPRRRSAGGVVGGATGSAGRRTVWSRAGRECALRWPSGQPPKNSPVTPPTIDWSRPSVPPSSTTRMPTVPSPSVSSPGSGLGDWSGRSSRRRRRLGLGRSSRG